jgi:hypothetical protein
VHRKLMIEDLGIKVKAGVVSLDWGCSRWSTCQLNGAVGVGGNTKWRWAVFGLMKGVDVPPVVDMRSEIER